MSIMGIQGCRANSDQDLIVCRSRLFNLLKLKISYAIVAIDNGFHWILGSSSVAVAVVG